MTVLKALDRWFTESTVNPKSLIDHSIQLQAFAIIFRDTVPFPQGVNIIVKCYQLDQVTDHHDFVVLIHQLIDRKDFYKVLYFVLMHK